MIVYICPYDNMYIFFFQTCLLYHYMCELQLPWQILLLPNHGHESGWPFKHSTLKIQPGTYRHMFVELELVKLTPSRFKIAPDGW